MKEFKILKIIDKFSAIYKKAGVDYDIFRLILNTKLTMDGRRKATVFNSSRNSKKDSNEFYKALILYGFIGIFFGLILIFNINKIYIMSIYFTGIMFAVFIAFISDFSHVILDVRDKNILSTKGIDSKTINAAKLTHVFIYMLYLTLAFASVSFIISFKYGILFALIFLMEIILLDIFMIIIATLAYLLVLKFFDGEKLKDIINYVQIALSIFMAIIYLIVPKIFEIVINVNITYKEKLWHLLIPPMWFSAPLSIVSGEEVTVIKIAMSVLAIALPIISIIMYIKFIPYFESNLQKLNSNESKIKENNKWLLKINKIFCKDTVERAFFNFSIGIINSEREFKLKVYPELVLGIVLQLVFLLPALDKNDISTIIGALSNSKSYLSIYVFALTIPTIIIMLRYSEKYLGAWIYQVTPITKSSSIFKGVIKGALYKLILIPYIIICFLYTLLFGPKVIIHLVIAFLAFILLIVINFAILKKKFPFSQKFEINNSGESVLIVLISLISILFMALLHFIITLNSIATFIYLIALIIIDFILWRFAFNISMEKLKR